MTRTEYMLHHDYNSWHFYATTELGISDKDALVLWNNEHNKGKYLICEARESGDTRLFIRTVTSILDDASTKKGWWDTFTVTKNPTAKGLWLSKVVEYRIDKNGYLNLEVETILPIDNIKFHRLFTFESDNGTWNSIAFWLMMVCSDAFLDKYDFQIVGSHSPNFKVLKEKYPELVNLNSKEIGKIMLHKYLRDEVTLEEIEECLNTPSDWELLVVEVQKAVAYHTVEKLYGEKYPLFSKKVSNNVCSDEFIYRHKVESYLKRQLNYYEELVNNKKIQAITDSNDWLAMIESALLYRKELKDEEKKEKKEKRKNKNVN